MRVIKSGIEMNASEVNALKGGSCGCYCDIGFSGVNMSVCGEEDNWCYCGCSDPYEPWVSGSQEALKRL